MPTTLTMDEAKDFAAAEASLQASQVLSTPDAALSTPSTHKKHHFTFKRLSRKNETIVEAESEDAGAFASSSVVSLGSESIRSSSTETGNLKHPVGPQDFDLLCVIGQEAFGKVLQVRHQPTDEILAMKTKSNVYLVMPFVAGGELFHHLQTQGLLLESSAKFYAAEMVLALEHLHSKGIIHRDLKPENVLLGADGQIRLTDFGLSKEMVDEDDLASTMCGTSEYMPPEMICRKAYNQAVDWWALGALIFEMVTGYPPFRHKNRKKLHHKILNEKLVLPQWLGSDTHSILKQLLERNVDKRLGSGKSTMFQVKGVQAIKKHAFFNCIEWGLLEQKKIQPPILPNVISNTDTTYFSKEFTKQYVGRRSHLDRSSISDDSKKLFARFSWVADDIPSFADIIRADKSENDSIAAIQNGVAQVALADTLKHSLEHEQVH